MSIINMSADKRGARSLIASKRNFRGRILGGAESLAKWPVEPPDGKKLAKHGYDLEQGGGNRQKISDALQECSHLNVEHGPGAAGRNKEQFVVDCLEMNYVSIGDSGALPSTRLTLELFSLNLLLACSMVDL